MEIAVTFNSKLVAPYKEWIKTQHGNWERDVSFRSTVYRSKQYPKYAYLVITENQQLEEFIAAPGAPKILGIRYFTRLSETPKNMKLASKLPSVECKLELSPYIILAIELPEGTFVPGLDACLSIAIGCTDEYLADIELLQFTTQWDALKVSAKKLVKMTKKKYSAYDTLEDAFIKEDGTVTFLTFY